jgi:uncharacterized membrane protein
MVYVIVFLFFAFVGWILDSLYSSIRKKKIVISGYFRGIPLCPIYGFGGILLLNSFAILSEWPFWITILVTTSLIITLEYVGGRLSEHLLEERLWDYSKESYNLHGYISAWHSFLWLIVVSMGYFIVGNTADAIFRWFGSFVTMNKHLEVLLLFVFIGLSFFATVKTKKIRLSRLMEKRLAAVLSIDEMFDWDKLLSLEEKRRKEIFSNKNIESFLEKIEKWKNHT